MPKVERLELATLKTGDNVRVKAGNEPEAFIYDFTVVEPGELPYCDFKQISPNGEEIGPASEVLEGSGQWTTPDQNPCQRGDVLAGKPHQEIATTIGWGRLRLGDFVMVLDATGPKETRRDRYQLVPECTEIIVSDLA